MTDIDVARVEALVGALKIALPQLVVDAVNALKPELPKLLPNLSDAEWEMLKREEDQRRREWWEARRIKFGPLAIHREWARRGSSSVRCGSSGVRPGVRVRRDIRTGG